MDVSIYIPINLCQHKYVFLIYLFLNKGPLSDWWHNEYSLQEINVTKINFYSAVKKHLQITIYQ